MRYEEGNWKCSSGAAMVWYVYKRIRVKQFMYNTIGFQWCSVNGLTIKPGFNKMFHNYL